MTARPLAAGDAVAADAAGSVVVKPVCEFVCDID